MLHKISNEKGSALIVVMSLLILITLISVSMHSMSDDEMSISINSKNMTKAFYSSEAGLTMAKGVLWSEYMDWASTNPPKTAGKSGNRATYQAYLDNIGVADSNTSTVVSTYDMGDGQRVDQVTVARVDISGATTLTVTSIGSADDGSSNTITSQLRVEGVAFQGFEFAILSNNVNCIMCHATIDNVDRIYNTDPSKDGTFDRVKIASLETMLIRTGSADSYIAGTVYTRGKVMDKSGNIITDLSPSGGGVEGYAINSTDGKIQEPLSATPLVAASGSPLPQNGNLYLDYPTNKADMTDGVLPEGFPPPFPDGNSNKIVDDADYAEVANNVSGGLSGGIIYGLASGVPYGSGTLPGAGNQASISNTYDGNLILVGTDANPIVLSGDIAVDGDVVIQGVVKGTGQIYARGNVYITGDLTYSDGSVSGNRTFGRADDGTQNALSIAAGKNVMVGDYLTPKKGVYTDPTSIDPGNQVNGEKFSFTMSEATLFNRREWTKTQQFLPDAGGNMTMNSTYDPSYKPRYYTMNAGDPVYLFNKYDIGQGKGTYWDPVDNVWKGKEHISSYDMNLLTKFDPGAPELTNAAVVPMSSTSNWITPENLKNIWIANDAARTPGDEYKIDGQIYTNNSIFALTREASNTLGKMTINGAIVASDVGVLVGGGLNLHYDQRLKNFLNIKDDSRVILVQTAWYTN